MFVVVTFIVGCGGPKDSASSGTPIPPRPTEDIYVVDDAKLLNAEARKHILATGAELDRRFGAQVVVLTVDKIDGNFEQFATDVFREWGVGNSEKNNGVLILLTNDNGGRRKVRVEVGYGLSGRFPASYVGELIDGIKPKLKSGDTSTGITQLYDAIVGDVYREYGEPEASAEVIAAGSKEVHELSWFATLVVVFLALWLPYQILVVVAALALLVLLCKIGLLDLLVAIISSGGGSSGGGFGGGSSGGSGCSDDW